MMEIAITIVSTRRWYFPLREQDHDVLLQTVRLQAALVSNLNGKGLTVNAPGKMRASSGQRTVHLWP